MSVPKIKNEIYLFYIKFSYIIEIVVDIVLWKHEVMNLKKVLLGILAIIAVVSVCLLIPFDIFDFTDDPNRQEKREKPQPSIVKIAAFGDIMMHGPQIKSGAKLDGGYDFNSFFQEVKPYLTSVDLAIGNFETTLAGPEKGYKGYPQFNAPDQIVDALKNTGVDIVSTANNHSMDTGVQGVKRTYKTLKQNGILPVGTAPSPEKRVPTIVKKNGITFAFLAYTEHTNGLPVPEDQSYLVNRIDSKQIAEDIKKSKALGAEFVIVSLHFGMEYQRTPNEKQIQVAHQTLQDGADVVLGSHPHVLQRMEKVKVQGKDKLIIYSMGNFISNQFMPYTDEGVILYFNVLKDPNTQKVQLRDVSYLPTMVHKYPKAGKQKYVVLPMESETPKTKNNYPGLSLEKWKQAFSNTVQLMKEKGSFPVYSTQD